MTKSTTRISRIKGILNPDETLLVSNPTNIRYLCGFSGSNGILLINQNLALLLTDPRYDIQSHQETFDVEIEIASDIWNALAKYEFNQIGIESAHLNVAKFDFLSNIANKVVRKDNLIESIRIVKDDDECKLIRSACQIATDSLTKLIESPLIGLTEKQIANKLERLMVDAGAEVRAFDTIVASGPNSAIPHHQPTERKLFDGDLLKIDFGAQFQGYKSDCTRTFIAGQPEQWQIDIHQATLAAQSVGRQMSRPGVRLGDVDKAVRTELTSCGYIEFFIHGLGHGVGLDIHEDPFFKPDSTGKIAPNMVITVEPGIYLPGRGGVRIEDTGVITDSGFENFTEFSYELIELK